MEPPAAAQGPEISPLKPLATGEHFKQRGESGHGDGVSSKPPSLKSSSDALETRGYERAFFFSAGKFV
ncbi:hypothetical protein A3H77_02040 [Candidatus Kaiserbacteria bacterium RIFCSPLOWO2_02_FULL_56_11]|uniref:Uncharacterized protein n=2 Tax=Candidatus Kaiseribacteriota TaxID=1752734 RepID=A0A1F6E2K7_9BACT|nr:MAG: hypothetical protein A3C95_00160 [Candidatus Kaiserbacteria bacterium RIFCSPHIGHO2_02_FULL_56_30]OGG72332.1 MAG: hypothetical protein A3E65_02385 [Candidatus Kaiserbacteria bacterium RIFCSPHIGHO2_12_FULL_56_13]OGG82227.1 MAG: hypothetical protein A3H77_02040 [Candidatus Kaiserbacteria bacterium RIFCSPLOWO2_02_FULL_56_11]